MEELNNGLREYVADIDLRYRLLERKPHRDHESSDTPSEDRCFRHKISISVGDEIRRKLPSGQEEVFEITDPKFFQEFHGTKGHYQLEYRRKGTFGQGQGGNYTVHITGHNSRVNIASVDRSTNVAVEGDVFGNLSAKLRKDLKNGPELARLLAAVEEMRAQKEKPGFAVAYQKFVAISADHLGIIAPFLPALTAFVSS